MKPRIVYFLPASILGLGLLLTSVFTPANAQGVPPTPTSVSLFPEGTPQPDTNDVYFYQMKQNDIQLIGPYDVTSLVFDLPAVTLGDIYPGKFEHSPIGQHPKGLAIDLNLFKDGVYLSDTDEHEPLGNYWEYLSDDARWGGRFSDGNHYEWMHWMAFNCPCLSRSRGRAMEVLLW